MLLRSNLDLLSPPSDKLRIVQRSKSKTYSNKFSGHSWTVNTPINKWDLISRLGVVATFTTYEAAEKAYEEYKAYQDKFPFEMPRSEREINKAIKLKLI